MGSAIRLYNIAVIALTAYFIILFFALGLTSRDVVGVMVHIVYFYGVPLSLFILFYLIIITTALIRYVRYKESFDSHLVYSTVMTAIAMLPMFFLDNRMATILSAIAKV